MTRARVRKTTTRLHQPSVLTSVLMQRRLRICFSTLIGYVAHTHHIYPLNVRVQIARQRNEQPGIMDAGVARAGDAIFVDVWPGPAFVVDNSPTRLEFRTAGGIVE